MYLFNVTTVAAHAGFGRTPCRGRGSCNHTFVFVANEGFEERVFEARRERKSRRDGWRILLAQAEDFFPSSKGAEDYAARVYRYMSLKNIEAFASPETLEQRVKQLSVDELAEEEKAAVRAFQRALKRRKQGKPDDEWGRDEEED